MSAGQFRDRHWNDRFEKMGDLAESAFERNYPKGKVRYGLDRPPVAVHKLPMMIRYTPDYLTSDGLFEVQGCGRDGLLKLKDEKLESLLQWDEIFDTFLWVYDLTENRYAYARISLVEAAKDRLGRGEFQEGKAYYEIPTEWFAGWRGAL